MPRVLAGVMVQDDEGSLSRGRPEIGFVTRYAQLLVVGAAFVVLGGFLANLNAVNDQPSEGLGHMALWSGWLGAVLLSASILLAGVTGREATPGVRTALIIGGAFLLVNATLNGFGFLASFGF